LNQEKAGSFLAEFQIEQFMAHGAGSVSFRAIDRNCRRIGVRRGVALAFYWDVARAREAAQRLARNDSVFEICGLAGYAEPSAGEAAVFLAESLAKVNASLGLGLKPPASGTVGVLALRLPRGAPLIRREPWQGTPTAEGEGWAVACRRPGDGRQVAVLETLTEFARDLTRRQRLRFLCQLTGAIAESHRRGVVHGDLSPISVLCCPESMRPLILDLGRDHFGVRGWQAPEHGLLMHGEIDALPPAADVFLLGLWLRRLLPDSDDLQTLAQACQWEKPGERPSAAWLQARLERALYVPFRRGWAAACLLLALAAFGLWLRPPAPPFSLPDEGYARVAALPFDGAPPGLLTAEMTSELLNAEPALETVRFAKARETAKSLTRHFREDLETRLALAAEALGGMYALGGEVTEYGDGRLVWRGALCQGASDCRRFEARGVSSAALAEAIAARCLRLLGLERSPTPVHDFFSTSYRANVLYSEANELLLNGRVNAALSLLEKALDIYDPEFHWARIRLAECRFKRNELAEAERLLTRLAETPRVAADPRMILACTEGLARIHAKRLEREAADERLAEAMALCRQFDLPLRMADLGLFEAFRRAERGDWDGAMASIQQARRLYRENDEAVGLLRADLAEAYVLAERGEFSAAKALLDRAEAAASRRKLDYLLAQVSLERSRQRLAASRLADGTRAPDDLLEARRVFEQVGDRAKLLVADYYAALFARFDGGAAESALSDLVQQAADSGDRALEIQSAISLADHLARVGRPERAEWLLKSLLESSGRTPPRFQENIYSRLWQFAARQNRFSEAKNHLGKSIEIARLIDNKKIESYALNNLGELYETMDELETAMSYYQKSLTIKLAADDGPGSAWTLRNLLLLAIKRNDLAAAEDYADRLERLDGSALFSRLALARLRYERGAYAEALAALTECRREALASGVWLGAHEALYETFRRAAADNRRHEPPPQFGNRL